MGVASQSPPQRHERVRLNELSPSRNTIHRKLRWGKSS